MKTHILSTIIVILLLSVGIINGKAVNITFGKQTNVSLSSISNDGKVTVKTVPYQGENSGFAVLIDGQRKTIEKWSSSGDFIATNGKKVTLTFNSMYLGSGTTGTIKNQYTTKDNNDVVEYDLYLKYDTATEKVYCSSIPFSASPSPNIKVSASGCSVNSSSFDSKTKKGEISLSGVSGMATITLTKEGELANVTQSAISNPGKNAYGGDLLRIVKGNPLEVQINNTSGADGDISTSVCFDVSGNLITYSTDCKSYICGTFFNSPVDFRSTSQGGTSTLPSDWSQTGTEGHLNWCQESNYYPYIINGSSKYIQSPDITLNNGKTYKIVVSTMCSSSAPSLKIYQSGSEISPVTSGSEFTFDGSNGTYNLRIYGGSGNTYIKTVEMYEICSSSPTISLSNCPVSGLTANVGIAGSSQTIYVSGSNLTSNITVTASSGFQVSTDGNNWNTSVNLNANSTNASVQVRIAATQNAGNVQGTLTFSSSGATSQTCTLSGTVVVPNVTVSKEYNCTISDVTFNANTLSGSFRVQQEVNKYAAVRLSHENLTINSKVINNINQNDIVLYSNEGDDIDVLKILGNIGESHVINFQISGGVITFSQSQSITLPSVPDTLFFTSVTNSPSEEQSITFSSTGLSAAITITIPSGFEVSMDGGHNYSFQNLSFSQNSSMTLQVRMATRNVAGKISGNLIFSSGNTTRICPLSGEATAPPTPTITISNCPSSFTANVNAVSASQNITVSSANLTERISISAPSEFEISTDNGNSWSSSGSLDANLTNASVQVRIAATQNTIGDIFGNLTFSSTGATHLTCALLGTIHSNATVSVSSSNTTFCEGDGITLTASASGFFDMASLTYQWKKDGVDIAGATSATYTFSALSGSAGVYTVTITSGVETATSQGITLTLGTCLPVGATVSLSANPNSYCEGNSIVLTAQPSEGVPSSGINYQWYLNSTLKATTQNATYTYVTTAEDNVLSFSVTITDGTRSASSNSITATKKTMGCTPATVTNEPFCNENTASSSFENVELESGWVNTPSCNNGNLNLNTGGTCFYNQGFNLSTSAQYTVTVTYPSWSQVSNAYIAVYTKNANNTYTLKNSQRDANISSSYTFSIDSDGEYYIGVVYTGNIQITNFKLEKLVSASPSIVTSVANLNEIPHQCQESSPIDSFTVIVSNLSTATATLGNNSNFEISLTPDFASANKTSLTLSEGTSTIYARLKGGLNQGNYTEEVTFAGEGISPNPVVTLSGNITPFSIGITGDGNLDYVCGDGTLTLNASPVGDGYSFQWLRGDTANTNVATYSPLSFTSSNCDATKDYAYAVEIKYGNCVVFSDPFIVYSRPDLPINASAVLNTSSSSVCSGESVTFTATLSANSLVSGDYTAEWFVNTLSAGLDTVTVSSLSVTISKTIFVSGTTTVGIIFRGCSNGNEVNSNNVVVSLKPSAECVFNNFYVKANGGSDSNNGTSWESSFATIDKALEAVQSYKTANGSTFPAYIHVAAGSYTPSTTNGYVLPSYVTLYGGYPANATVSASRNPYSPANTGGNATILKQKDNMGKTLSLSSVQHVTLTGLALEGSGNSVDISGQAINVFGNCIDITIDSCYIHNYRRENNDLGAICLSSNGSQMSVTIKNSVINDNLSSRGTVVIDNAQNTSVINIENTSFSGNKRYNNFSGGSALYSSGSFQGTINVTNCTFHNNETGNNNAVISKESSATLNIRNTTITGTFASYNENVNVSNSLILLPSSGGSFSNSVNNYTSTDASAFLALFEGNGTLQNCGFTQVLIPDTTNTTVKNNVINQNIALVEGITIDQCGNERIVNATTLGAYEVSSYSVILNTSAVLLCSGENATVSATATGYKNPVFTWTKNGTILTEETGNSIIINTGGTYGVSVTENGDQSTERIDSKNIETPKTGSSLAIESSAIDYCYAFSTLLKVKDSENSQPLSNIQWKKNGTEMSSYVDTVISVSHFDMQKNAVTYSVTATACDGTVLPEKSVTFTPKTYGCSSTLFTMDTVVSFCNGMAVLSLEAVESVPSGLTYEWSYAATNQADLFTSMEANSAEITATQEGYYKVTVRYGGERIESYTIHVYDRGDCVINYFVRSEDGNDTDNGETWENAFKTINKALDVAVAYHTTDPDKQIAIHIGAGAGTDYQIDNQGDRYKLNYIEIKGGFPINNTNIETGNANDTTTITKSTGTNSCFEIGKGKVFLSRLKFSGMSGNRVITSGSTEENDVTFEDCRFVNNTAGAVSLSSASGGKAVFYDCIFDGNKSPNNAKSFNGYALKVIGPYDLLVSTKKTELPEKVTDISQIVSATDASSCTKEKTMKLSLLDSLGYSSLSNRFISNVTGTNGDSDKGGAIYVEGAEKVQIEYANFQSNSLSKGINGGAISLKSVKSVNIIGSYFINNKITESSNIDMEGGSLYAEDISVMNVYLCHFKNNIMNEGNGAAFACRSSELNIQNSYFGNNQITNKGFGCGFYAHDSALVNIYNSKFEYNKMMNGTAAGGGAYVKGAIVNINNSLFQYNFAGEEGGAFYAEGNKGTAYAPNTLIAITNSIFKENGVVSGSGKGGVIYAENMRIKIVSSFFYRNNAREASAPIYLQNGMIKVFSSSFYDNRSTTENQTAGALYISGSPITGNAAPNAYLYNSTFTQNGGAQKGIVYIDNAYADIVSCTIVDNDGRRFSSGNDSRNTDATEGDMGGTALHLGTSAKINLVNTIISGNKNKSNGNINRDMNVGISDASVVKFKYNTIGNTIYGADRNTLLSSYQSESCAKETSSDKTCSITNFTCSGVTFTSDSLMPLCNYSIAGRFTRPFKEKSDGSIPCRDYGMSIQELETYLSGKSLEESDFQLLKEEIVHDAHNSIRGWRRLCLDCGAVTEDIAADFRTFQGAVEGGKGVYLGNTFIIELSRVPSRCLGSHLTNPYLIISMLNSETGAYIPVDSLQNYFYVTVEQFQADDSTYSIFGSYNDFSLIKITSNPFTLDDFRAGFYRVTIKEKENGKILESHSSFIKIEDIASTNLLWTGLNENWSDINNWAYCDDYGKYIKASDIIPTTCYDVHIGNTYTDGSGVKQPVGALPTIDGTSGDCANIYFHPGGSLGQIHKLNYVKAFVEMEIEQSLTRDNWYMLSPVLKEMYPKDYAPNNLLSYIRYFSVEKDAIGIKGVWSKTIADVDVNLSQRGMGYVFSTRYREWRPTETVTLSYPNIESQLSYYDGTIVPVKRTNKAYRFIMENDDDEFDTGNVTITIDLNKRGFLNDSTATEKPETGYVIVGNPYMSHLDLISFRELNKNTIDPNIKLFTKGNFPAFDASQLISTGADETIAPLQAFFIKPYPDAIQDGKLNLVFNAEQMSVVDKSVVLRSSKQESDLIRIRSSIRTSILNETSIETIVVAKDNASNKFVEGEDGEKLFSDNSIIDIYTMSEGKSLDINVLNSDSLNELLLPINIKTKKKGYLSLEIDGVLGFLSADKISFIDSLTGEKTSLFKQNAFEIKKTTEEDVTNRFYLFFEKKDNDDDITNMEDILIDEDDNLFIIGIQGGIVVELKGNEKLQSIFVYDMASKEILSKKDLNCSYYGHKLPINKTNYIVKVITNKRVEMKKIFVK